ncbi:glycoside hydrolase family 13 protein [Pseudoalteromonas sp. HL-AS1]|uniref:glycoside hydrolase family 13 protein n=1 Tax=Pseudoalteromonas sp. HL-AS1 TaxID=3071081 RepID=UPI0028162435|nr:glycoside hydrolase family 13 protein [Pseudoalteromonas sp. HL-AS1]WMS92277.1 glycoside hydrolase family 13 protein [Pseudoalteromonas sp. HL-AS1]
MKRFFQLGLLAASVNVYAATALSSTSADTAEFVPQWAKKAVWYQIFPERFRNGDLTNDPTVDDIKGADPRQPPVQWRVHPWGSDWYELQDYERANQQANNETAISTHLLRRRYGGDLQGIIDKLDYLADLGINAIYLNPVFDAPSLHKYDAASYHHIDPNFGPDPQGDRALMMTENPLDPNTWVWTKADELAIELIHKAHHKGIRIIFDGVFNHMGINSFAFQNLTKNQAQSPYKDWFSVISFDDQKRGTKFDYEGWFGVKSLPEFKEDQQGLAKGPKEYIFAATQRWMNPKGMGSEYGIDGWRLDVAYCIGHGFWKEWRSLVKAINPEAYLTAEIVDTPENVKPYMQGDEFDGEMNYNFAFTAAEFLFNPPHMAITAAEFDSKLAELRSLYPKGVAYVVQNLFGSHDSNRIGSHIVNRGVANFRDWQKYFSASQVAINPAYDVSKPKAKDIQLQKLFAVLQMTYVGAPMIYYGDEVGMWGANDPDTRKPMLWSDIEYKQEIHDPDGSQRKPDSVSINYQLKNLYKQLIALRKTHQALSIGSYKTILADSAANVFVFQRQYKDETVWVVINNAQKQQNITLPIGKFNAVTTLFSQSKAVIAGQAVSINVPAKSAAVFQLN